MVIKGDTRSLDSSSFVKKGFFGRLVMRTPKRIKVYFHRKVSQKTLTSGDCEGDCCFCFSSRCESATPLLVRSPHPKTLNPQP